jgi:hypothetical protein
MGDYSMRNITLLLTILLPAVGAFSGGALADQDAATRCRAGLNPEATLIYDETLPLVTPSTVIRDALTSETRSLVMAGSVSMGTARDNAEAAGECFRALRQ